MSWIILFYAVSLAAMCWLVHDNHPGWAVVPAVLMFTTSLSVNTKTTTEDDKK